MQYLVAIVAIARNEGKYINEWIEYHHALGFEQFYIFDNSSAFKRMRYRQLTKKLTFQSGIESASDEKFVNSVNPTKDEVTKVQKTLLLHFPIGNT